MSELKHLTLESAQIEQLRAEVERLKKELNFHKVAMDGGADIIGVLRAESERLRADLAELKAENEILRSHRESSEEDAVAMLKANDALHADLARLREVERAARKWMQASDKAGEYPYFNYQQWCEIIKMHDALRAALTAGEGKP